MNLAEKLVAVRGAGIRIIARTAADVSDEELQELEHHAHRIGYVPVDAHRPMPVEQRRRLWHRHLVLIHRGDASRESLQWIRELALASPRAHAVVLIAPQPDRVHEAADRYTRTLLQPASSQPGPLGVRAARLWHRKRWAAARRWTAAAVERARRSQDDDGTAQAFAQLIGYSHVTDEEGARRLVARGLRLLAGIESLAARSHVVSVLADLWIETADFELATAGLAAIDVECELTGCDVPPWVRDRQCEIACWQGRWDEADVLARDGEHFGWRAVAAFARRDWPTLQTLEMAASATVAVDSQWRALIDAMSRSSQGDVDSVRRIVGELRQVARPLRWRDALILESLHIAGAEDEARKWISEVDSRKRGRAEGLLWHWLTGGSRGLESEVRRLGVEGIRRWGLGRQDMRVWAGVSTLLTEVHEAEDAATAMRRGCRWARDYTGVDAVTIMAADGLVMARSPDDARPPDEPCQREALRYGGVRIGDVLIHGVPRDQSEARAVSTALATACAPALRASLDDLQLSRAGESLATELLGVSPAVRALRESVARAAASTFAVLIEGESGTGKELVARAIHRLSARRDRCWAAVNCAALTDELLEAELFGHVRGAFTGAVGPRMGLLEGAHEGTLFLDEVAELSPRAQAKLLRVLQEGEIRRVGENASRRVDVRLVTATNRSLAHAARQGAYREDLIYRLAVIRLRVPPLRDRIEDVPVLAHAFWRTIASKAGTRAVLGPDAVAALCRAAWPGNVRELQNVIAALAVGGPSVGRIGSRQVDALLAERTGPDHPPAPLSLAGARLQCDRRTVAASLARHANQRAAAARELGVSRQALAKLIARLEIT